MDASIHPTAEVADDARVGPGTKVWHQAQVMSGAVVGAECILGKGAFVDGDVTVGDRCKLQNYACIYHGSTLGDGVFVGPGAVLANDRYPRAVTPDGALKTDDDWEVAGVTVGSGASIGAGAVLAPGVNVGPWAMVGAGAVVTGDVAPHALVVGIPARSIGEVCTCGRRLDPSTLTCPACRRAWRRVGETLEEVEH